MATPRDTLLILATGGTIAGAAAEANDNLRYAAASIGVEELVAAVPALSGRKLQVEQLAQVDSKDMSLAIWLRLSARIRAALRSAHIAGIVVTHGTDTLEETAYWLHRTVPAARPVVLTAAMRPATSLQADGPQNLLDAVTVAGHAAARGVVAVIGGRVLAADELRKVHNYRIDAFSSGDAGPLALIEEGHLRCLRPWPGQPAGASMQLPGPDSAWPWVEIVASHAGADGRIVDLLASAGVDGLVVAATGNGSVHRDLDAALQRAHVSGVAILRATRCQLGSLVPDGLGWPGAGALTPAQARVALLLKLAGERRRPRRAAASA
jgi:L-asparaginase